MGRAPVSSVALDARGSRLATGTSRGTARVWALPSGQALTPTLRAGGQVGDIALTPDGRLLATADIDGPHAGGVRMWNLRTPRAPVSHAVGITFPAGPAPAEAVAFGKDGSLLATGDDSNALDVFSVPSLKRVWSIDTLRGVRGLAFSADGDQIAEVGVAACTGPTVDA